VCIPEKRRMPSSKAKLDELCREVLQKADAKAAVVIVVTASLVGGVAIQEDFGVMGGQYHVTRLPKLLRYLADEIEKGDRNK
jgi:hypothetical protein